jgi:uncharacterized protein YpmB
MTATSNSSFKYDNIIIIIIIIMIIIIINNSMQFSVCLCAYTTAQRPIIKRTGTKMESKKHIHMKTNETKPKQGSLDDKNVAKINK